MNLFVENDTSFVEADSEVILEWEYGDYSIIIAHDRILPYLYTGYLCNDQQLVIASETYHLFNERNAWLLMGVHDSYNILKCFPYLLKVLHINL